MHVVPRPIHNYGPGFHPLERSGEIGKEFGLDLVAQMRLSLLGAEDGMDEDLGVRVGHYIALLGLAGIMTRFLPRLSPWAT
jgi:hypothetical protein